MCVYVDVIGVPVSLVIRWRSIAECILLFQSSSTRTVDLALQQLEKQDPQCVDGANSVGSTRRDMQIH